MNYPKINELTPVLVTDKMDETIKYYQETMGFHLDFTWPNEGSATHAGFSIGPVTDGIHNEDDHVHFHLSLTDKKICNSGWLFINISEIDELYKFYKNKMVNITIKLDDFPWGYREFEITDNNGHKFRFTKKLVHTSK